MRLGPIILAVSTIGVVLAIGPHLSAGGDAAATGTRYAGSAGPWSKQAAASSHRESSKEAWLTGSTVLDRQRDGHFYADATVNQRDTHFLVDTGASVVALTAADAEAAGLRWDDNDLSTIGRGASGDVKGVAVRLDSLELGGYEARNVDAVIVPEGLDVSLLGQSFLSQLHGVRIEDDRMILGG